MVRNISHMNIIDTKPPRGWENIESPAWSYIATSLLNIKAAHDKMIILFVNCNNKNTYYVAINLT